MTNAANEGGRADRIPEASSASRLKFVFAFIAALGAGSAALPRDASAESWTGKPTFASEAGLRASLEADKRELAELQRRERELKSVPISGFDAGPTEEDKARGRRAFLNALCKAKPEDARCK